METVRGLQDAAGHLLELLGPEIDAELLQQPGRSDDGGERRPQLVRQQHGHRPAHLVNAAVAVTTRSLDTREAGVDGGQEVFGRDRLHEVVVRPRLHARPHFRLAGEEQEGERRQLRIGPDGLEDPVPVEAGHVDVADHDLGGLAADEVEALHSVCGRQGLMPRVGEDLGHHAAELGLVVDEDDPRHARDASRPGPAVGCASVRPL
jgi:hypothetical protein